MSPRGRHRAVLLGKRDKRFLIAKKYFIISVFASRMVSLIKQLIITQSVIMIIIEDITVIFVLHHRYSQLSLMLLSLEIGSIQRGYFSNNFQILFQRRGGGRDVYRGR